MKSIKQHFKIRNNDRYSIREVIVIAIFISLVLTSISTFIVYKYISNKNLYVNDITEVYNKIITSYLDDVKEDELSEAAINGMMEFLGEKYSIFLDAENTNLLVDKLDGQYEGIGIQIKETTDNNIEIVDVFDDTPASLAGLKRNDIITKIDNTLVKDIKFEEINKYIKNKNSVKIEYLRNNKKNNVEVIIKKIDTPVVKTEIFEKNDKKVGYIYLQSFSQTSATQVKNALKKLEKSNIDSLIFDVRSNSGGYLTSVTDILELFLKKGKILYNIETKKSKTTYYAKTKNYKEYPVVVLVDSLSASASEILATTLKESYGAIIVGTKTYGKGKVQQTSSLSSDSMIKYTTANWYTPTGNSINEVGVMPGIYVELTKDYLIKPGYDTDAQLQKALEIITENY